MKSRCWCGKLPAYGNRTYCDEHLIIPDNKAKRSKRGLYLQDWDKWCHICGKELIEGKMNVDYGAGKAHYKCWFDSL